MLLQRTLLALAAVSTVAAVPLEKRRLDDWLSNSASSFIDFGKRHSWGGRNAQPGQCNLAAVQLPQAPKPLPEPSEGLQLYHVAVGRGTQNYTCDLSNTTAVPQATGALASLFNVTCMSADNPLLLSKIPDIALQLPVPSTSNAASPASQDLSGHHYFTDLTTAYFNLDTSLTAFGQGAFKKINSTNAPADAMDGQWGQGNGAVAWLKLQAKSEDECAFQEVYRVNTAGGQPPATCEGQQAAFEIQYSAEYWFYS
ncbi:Hypothetical predicted protein [Lecanosticta acicola]|uniref:Malate dehydrogenase n=1 Tax=Lecanosticta acicola TaxID=111012 RepID=A0AAI8Z7N9_9PEZI|nr:Hypothetical predicted protein [Lecanosticta acicola]